MFLYFVKKPFCPCFKAFFNLNMFKIQSITSQKLNNWIFNGFVGRQLYALRHWHKGYFRLHSFYNQLTYSTFKAIVQKYENKIKWCSKHNNSFIKGAQSYWSDIISTEILKKANNSVADVQVAPPSTETESYLAILASMPSLTKAVIAFVVVHFEFARQTNGRAVSTTPFHLVYRMFQTILIFSFHKFIHFAIVNSLSASTFGRVPHCNYNRILNDLNVFIFIWSNTSVRLEQKVVLNIHIFKIYSIFGNKKRGIS